MTKAGSIGPHTDAPFIPLEDHCQNIEGCDFRSITVVIRLDETEDVLLKGEETAKSACVSFIADRF